MWWWMATLGTPAVAADMPEPVPPVVYSQQAPPSRPIGYDRGSYAWRLQRARNLRTAGVGLSIGGLAVIVPGLLIALAGGLDDSPAVYNGGLAVAVAGAGAALVGPGVTLAGGYTARRIVVELGGRSAPGLDVAAWVAYGATPFTGVAWFPAVGFSWAFANTMISRAERLLREQRPDRSGAVGGPAEHRFTVRALPTFDALNRRAGLRVDVVY